MNWFLQWFLTNSRIALTLRLCSTVVCSQDMLGLDIIFNVMCFVSLNRAISREP